MSAALDTIRKHASAHAALACSDAYSAQEAPRLAAAVAYVEALERAARRVAALNPAAGEIGAGMLATIVDEARQAVGEP